MAIFYTDSASIENATVQTLNVLGTSSIAYAANLNIENNVIKLGNSQALRYAGLDFVDSGSNPVTSASLYFDSNKNEMLYRHNGGTTSSVLLLGPETYNNFGSETYLTQNRIPKGSGIEHLNDSNITDTGALVSILGPLSASGGITGSGFFGTSSHAVSSSFAISASYAPGGGGPAFGTVAVSGQSDVVADQTNDTLTFVAGTNVTITTDAGTDSITINASGGSSFPYDGTTTPAVITGSLIVTGSTLLGAVRSTSVLDPTNPETVYISASNINALHVHGTVNDYMQIESMNMSNGTNASADFVATADNGTELGNYIDLGINSTGYTGGIVGGASDGYLYLTSSVGELHIGHAGTTNASNIRLFAGGPNSDNTTRIFISSSGQVGIGTLTPSSTSQLQVQGSISASALTGSLTDGGVTNIREMSMVVSGTIAAPGGSTVTLNLNNSNYFSVSASSTGTVTWVATNPQPTGRVQTFVIEYTNGGVVTNSWFSGIRWPGGVAPTLTSGTNPDLLAFTTDDAGTNWRGNLIQRNSS